MLVSNLRESSLNQDFQACLDQIQINGRHEGPLSSRVYTALRDAILAVSIPPGTRIDKGLLCDHFGVSKGTLSDALTRLASEELVEIVPQQGTTVTLLSRTRIAEASFLREAIETACAAHIALHRTEQQLAELQRNVAMQELVCKDDDLFNFLHYDDEFHAKILAFTGYHNVIETARGASIRVARARRQIKLKHEQMEDTLADHRAILDAISRQDAEDARKHMSLHIRKLVTRLEDFANTHPDLFTPE